VTPGDQMLERLPYAASAAFQSSAIVDELEAAISAFPLISNK
jgi:hypothetical protein